MTGMVEVLPEDAGAGRRRVTADERAWSGSKTSAAASRSAARRSTRCRTSSFEVNQGEFVAVIGRSGSGKTTLLNVIAGLDQRHAAATSTSTAQDVSAMNDTELTELRRHRLGFVFQSFGLLPLLSAYENVEIALRIAGAPIRERGRRANELLEMVGLDAPFAPPALRALRRRAAARRHRARPGQPASR